MADFVDEYYQNKDLSLLKKLTLVIPTHNRNYYLSRSLWYHAHFPFGQIIVADSSPEEKKVVNRETVARIRETFRANILYLEYEPETDKYGGDIYRKWGDAVQHVNTEYSQISVDKEFLIPTTIQKCLRYLEENPEYIVADGNCYFLRKDMRRKEYVLISRRAGKHSEDDDNAYIRFKDAFIDTSFWTNDLLPALFRSSYHKEVYKNLDNYQIADIRYGEMVLGYLGHLHGKYYHDDTIYLIKDDSNLLGTNPTPFIMPNTMANTSSPESSTTRYPYLHLYKDILETKTFFDRYRKCIVSEIQKYTNLTDTESETFFDQYVTYSHLLKSDTGKPTPYMHIVDRWILLVDLLFRLPKYLRKCCDAMISLFLGRKTGIDKIDLIKLSNSPETEIINKIEEETVYLNTEDKTLLSLSNYMQSIPKSDD